MTASTHDRKAVGHAPGPVGGKCLPRPPESYAEWQDRQFHTHHFPDGTIGYEWALDSDNRRTAFGTRLGIQPPDGTGNGCPCAECRRLRPNEWESDGR